MTSSDIQKSEVHETTADADTGDVKEAGLPVNEADLEDVKLRRESELLTKDDLIVADETDVGGPLIIQSNDPALNPPRMPQDPFPADRTPEIDLPLM